MAAGSEMADFVLVHSAWFGGWCWNKLVPLLAGHGHSVHTPTLTALGERSHLARPADARGRRRHHADLRRPAGSDPGRDKLQRGGDHRRRRPGARPDLSSSTWMPSSPATGRPVGPDPAAAAPCDGDAGPDRRLRVAAAPDGGTAMGTVRPRGLQVTDEADLTWMLARLRPTPLGHFTSPVRLVNPQRNGRRGPASGAVAGRTRASTATP